VPVVRYGQNKRTGINKHPGCELGSWGWGCKNAVFKEGLVGAVKRWGDSFERKCQIMWEQAKK